MILFKWPNITGGNKDVHVPYLFKPNCFKAQRKYNHVAGIFCDLEKF